jgi:hypothetical protein
MQDKFLKLFSWNKICEAKFCQYIPVNFITIYVDTRNLTEKVLGKFKLK